LTGVFTALVFDIVRFLAMAFPSLLILKVFMFITIPVSQKQR